jgi:hypothetical protein
MLSSLMPLPTTGEDGIFKWKVELYTDIVLAVKISETLAALSSASRDVPRRTVARTGNVMLSEDGMHVMHHGECYIRKESPLLF